MSFIYLVSQSLAATLLVLVVGLGRRLAADQAGPASTAARLALYSCTGIPATSDQNSREHTYREHTDRSWSQHTKLVTFYHTF